MRNIFATFFSTVAFFSVALAQPTVDLSLTPTQLVQDVLAGPGVQISNAKFNDNANYSGNRIGKFTYTGTQISFPAGIVMGSGGVSNPAGTGGGMIGPNNSGSYNLAGTGSAITNNQDAQLQTYSSNIYDIGRLEFDFIPVGNKVSFEFIFGSDEYNEFVCSSFYDVFGFFVTGPKPGGGNYTNQNLALVPNTTLPITINTINNGSSAGGSSCPSGGLANSQYFAGAPGNHFQMDGATKALTIEFNVVCGETYHFKFAIADVGDANYDSWVFLKAGSFSSEAVQVSVATVSGDNTVIEGCSQADIIFTRPKEQSDTAMTVIYELGGNAIEGVDYEALPNPIQFEAGKDSLTISLIPIKDGVTEGVDSVIITTKVINQCGDTIISQGTIYILDSLDIFTTVNNPIAYCANDSIQITVSASGGVPPFTYQWSNGATTSSTYVPVGLTGPYDHYITVTDACDVKHKDTVHVTLQQSLKIDTLIAGASESCKNTGFASGYASGFSGTPEYTWIGPKNDPDTTNLKNISDVGSGWYYFTVKDNQCSITDSVFIEAINAPQAIISPDKTDGCNPTTFNLGNESTNATSYIWNTGSGYYAVSNKNVQAVELTSTKTVYLIATNGTCSDTAKVTLSIVNCGCTDATAINFDANATKDDGSCIYHGPEVVLPNVFTPNGDNGNDTYQFIAQNYVVEIEYWIFNRWGNVMFHTNQLNTYWDGKVNGINASEGVYFIKWTAKGLNDEQIEGHTFFHLFR
ncbi:MAG TPA: choice-of-anchor L domain-containing protein [Crocinitomicaceae bacterium]|nr:choice-of-anchor L domain-containing protein [Crocinitomicaceae bacterium]